jgi:hypothetical protein
MGLKPSEPRAAVGKKRDLGGHPVPVERLGSAMKRVKGHVKETKKDREEMPSEDRGSESAAAPGKCVATPPTKDGFFGIGVRPDPVERAAQVGRLCGIAAMLLRSTHPLVALLRQAERDQQAFAQALDMVGAHGLSCDADSDLALVDGTRKLGLGAVTDHSGAGDRPAAHIKHLGRFYP